MHYARKLEAEEDVKMLKTRVLNTEESLDAADVEKNERAIGLSNRFSNRSSLDVSR